MELGKVIGRALSQEARYQEALTRAVREAYGLDLQYLPGGEAPVDEAEAGHDRDQDEDEGTNPN